MKISNKISIIAGVSTLALVGTAFAAWQFNKNAEKSVNSNVVITKDTSVGEIELSQESWFLTLDQNDLCWTKKNYNESEEAVAESEKLTTVTVTYTGSEKASDVSDVTLSANFTADAALATYVTVTGGSLAEPTSNANVKESVYTLPTLDWAKKPSKQKDFDAMKTALASAKVTFTFKAEIAK